MCTSIHRAAVLLLVALVALGAGSDAICLAAPRAGQPYACEEDLIEVMFAWGSKVRLRGESLVDFAGNALLGVEPRLQSLAWFEWERICDVPEWKLDELQANGEANARKPLYNLNNIYRLRIPEGHDVWALSLDLEALPGVMSARPVPRPMALPTPPNYVPSQDYLRPASSTPTGINADYAWTQSGGDGTGIVVVDLEYSWNYDHQDVSQASGSQVNTNVADPEDDTRHGTAVIGVLCSDDNPWGTTGVSHGATLKTCGTYYGASPVWNVPGAIAKALDNCYPGDVLLLEQQWDLTGSDGFVPIEWWTDTYPDQTYNAVYAAIATAAYNGYYVVECAGNGSIDMDGLNWFLNCDTWAIIVGAGGAYPGGTWSEGDLERLSFSSHGARCDLQGWGENVVTTGYGDLYDLEGEDLEYTDTFDGTSSAGPVVAGAVACCASWWRTNVTYTTPSAPAMRTVLGMSGTSQVNPSTGWIGPRPDLQKAFHVLGNPEWYDATTAPLNDNGTGHGVAWGDYDGDGDQDLYIVNSYGANHLFRNDGGGSFTDVSSSPINNDGYGRSAAWADYDNDGDLDLYLVNYGSGNRLFRNEGAGVFTIAPAGAAGDVGLGCDAVWGDYDNDGFVDLYLVNYASANKLFHNESGATFTDATGTGPLGDGGSGTASAWGDYDDDGDLDLYLANVSGGSKLFRNDGVSGFTNMTSGALGNDASGVAWGDHDNDGDLDLVVSGWEYTKVLRNDGGTFVPLAFGPITRVMGGSPSWLDYDNDGDLDLYFAATSIRDGVFMRNDGGGVFIDASWGPIADHYSTQGQASADYDGDGDLDVYVMHDGSQENKLLRNEVGSANHWLHIDLVGGDSNRSGIGARVRVVVGGQSQIREVSGGSGLGSQDSLTAEFGLGSSTVVDSLIVRWPSGSVDVSTAIPADQRIVVTESGSSVADGERWDYRLYANSPNPFGPNTVVRYALRERAVVRLRVYDVAGRRVRTLVDSEAQAPGPHEARWDGRDDAGHAAASGVYFYRLQAGPYTESRRMVLLR